MEASEFFDRIRPWSERKHRLLQKYLPPFIAKVATTSARREIYIVDGFAGAARYDDGAKGSPILIAEFGDVCAKWTRPANLRLINVEADRKKEGIFDSLEAATASWVRDGRVSNLHSEFVSAVSGILGTIGSAPSLFFIDPFGPTALAFDQLVPILSRKGGVTELIINFDQDGLRRIVDAALSPNTDPKTAATNAQNVSAIMGSDDWRSTIEGQGLGTAECEKVLLRLYLDKLATYDFDVVAYPIREALHTNPKYHYVYCTRHQDGLLLMNNFIREEEDSLYDEHVETKLTLFSDEASLTREVDNRRSKLSKLVINQLQAMQTATRKQLRGKLIQVNFAEFHEKDYTAVINDLLKDGKVRARSGKTRINDDEPLSLKA
ncbi:MAG TPA: three-Cys-motif partner protein TcmP [Pyrinomonadaceae bacterium]|jgi:three-Cys-motif partner protein|nr:three-Cys-motif partner protein TcmP [Pyrinomonadaceae bacterium]